MLKIKLIQIYELITVFRYQYFVSDLSQLFKSKINIQRNEHHFKFINLCWAMISNKKQIKAPDSIKFTHTTILS